MILKSAAYVCAGAKGGAYAKLFSVPRGRPIPCLGYPEAALKNHPRVHDATTTTVCTATELGPNGPRDMVIVGIEIGASPQLAQRCYGALFVGGDLKLLGLLDSLSLSSTVPPRCGRNEPLEFHIGILPHVPSYNGPTELVTVTLRALEL